MTKKVLLLANNDVGLYNFRRELLEQLIGQGYKVYISLPYGDKVEPLKSLGCIYINTPIQRRGTNPFTDLKLMINYYRMIRKVRPKIVLTYTIKPNLYGSIVCLLSRTPYINNITGLGSGFSGKKLVTKLLIFMYKVALKKSTMVFFQNKADMDFMLHHRMISGKYSLIPGSGVNLNQFQYAAYPPEGKWIFTFIGRIMKEKGIEEFLSAARAIKQKYNNTQFNIIGSIEPTQAFYRELIAQYEAKNYVKYHGFQKDVIKFIVESHCIIQPSHHEGMSNILLESAAVGRALIASDIPGCREAIDDNGYVFSVGDVNDLIRKIEDFIHLPYEKKVAMGKMSRQKVEREFDRQIVINKYLQEINEVLQNRKAMTDSLI
jgi:galacturonosyltransferase